MAPPRPRKIAVVGSRAVGKSSMTVQFVEEHFVESYYPTIENQFSKIIRYKGQDYATEILDTAGQDEFSIMNQKHSIGVHGYVLVYSITSRSSFDMIRVIRDKILNNTGTESIPMVVVGNKSDLGAQRKVETIEGRNLAQEWNCPFVETSARHNANIAKVFELLIGEIEKYQNPTPDASGKCTIA
ncbi:small GTPase superfamily [Lipomyces tetrasporus]|uniref:Small GTPase superfamily n=1 Tax=Lipomyces tetrasporus TaxID=54092 RepID=A0AAD7QUB0_9ASCO|nr:small GTPase superfamily [Lipomyces tetrasporus]KAJ8101106.1 small GTPase superfamily [Lipomyces tetrasporus]